MNTSHEALSALERSVISVCEACGNFIEYWGFKSIHGKIWSYLALSARPLSQQDLVHALGMSKGSISIAINELIGYGLVRPSAEHRHAPYEAVMDVWPVISQVLREREWMLLESARISLEGLLTQLDRVERQHRSGDMSLHHLNLERIRALLQMTEWAQSVLRVILNARLPKTTDRWGTWLVRATQWGKSLRGAFDQSEDYSQ